MPIKQLIYSPFVSRKTDKSDLYTISRIAREKQSIYSYDCITHIYRQAIFTTREGEREIASQLFKKISKDKHHYDVQTIGESDIDIGTFPNRNMALCLYHMES